MCQIMNFFLFILLRVHGDSKTLGFMVYHQFWKIHIHYLFFLTFHFFLFFF